MPAMASPQRHRSRSIPVSDRQGAGEQIGILEKSMKKNIKSRYRSKPVQSKGKMRLSDDRITGPKSVDQVGRQYLHYKPSPVVSRFMDKFGSFSHHFSGGWKPEESYWSRSEEHPEYTRHVGTGKNFFVIPIHQVARVNGSREWNDVSDGLRVISGKTCPYVKYPGPDVLQFEEIFDTWRNGGI